MDNKFIRVDEVAQELSVSKPYAYMNNPERNPSPVRRMEITNPFCWKSRFR